MLMLQERKQHILYKITLQASALLCVLKKKRESEKQYNQINKQVNKLIFPS